MTPVVRIPDEVYERLKALAEPFIDTPVSVIERLLAEYEDAESVRGSPEGMLSRVEGTPVRRKQRTAGFQASGPRLFLAPASGPNLDESLRNPVDLMNAKFHLERAQFEELENALDGEKKFKCWAMTAKRRSLFRQMQIGDFVLFSEKGTGLFGMKGRVLTKFESRSFGEACWPVEPGAKG